jgi:hypothetical protein
MEEIVMESIYFRQGKMYRKLGKGEIIEEGAMQSWEHGELQPIMNTNGETIGDTPSSFSNERDFYNPIEEISLLEFQKEMELIRVNNGWVINLEFNGIWIITIKDKESWEFLASTGATGLYGVLVALKTPLDYPIWGV